MNNEVRTEILFNIQSYFEEQVDELQLFNHLSDNGDYFQLNAYGEVLKFNKDDGSLITDE